MLADGTSMASSVLDCGNVNGWKLEMVESMKSSKLKEKSSHEHGENPVTYNLLKFLVLLQVHVSVNHLIR